MPVNNVIFNYKEWPFYQRQIMPLERGKQILPPRDYTFSAPNLELPDNLLLFFFLTSAERCIHKGEFMIISVKERAITF